MANPKKIRLVYFWADESVMRYDFAKKISKRTTEWSNAFFAPYGFQLDVLPGPNESPVAVAHKFALTKADGIRPNPGLGELLEKKYNPQIEAIEKRIAAHRAEMEALDRQLRALDPHDSVGAIRIYDRTLPLYDVLSGLEKAKQALSDAREQEEARGDYQSLFRLQMAQKFETDNIGDGIRLHVVFCRYEHPPLTGLSMRRRMVVGETMPQIGATIVRRQTQLAKLVRSFMGSLTTRWLWPFRFITIDLDHAGVSTLSHEIVHAAGHSHPEARTFVKNLDKYLRYVPADPTGTLLDRAITTAENRRAYQGLFHELEGGFFDGAANDIMNYWAEGREPSDFILSEEDKKLLNEWAKFVSP